MMVRRACVKQATIATSTKVGGIVHTAFEARSR
jgi:hypothetical protein